MIARWLVAPLALVMACGATTPAPAPASAPTAAPVDDVRARAVVARVAGTYAITDEAIAVLRQVRTSPETIASVARLELTATPGAGLLLRPVGQPGVELARARDGTYYNEHDDIRVTFELPPSGHVTSIVVTQGPLVLPYVHVDAT